MRSANREIRGRKSLVDHASLEVHPAENGQLYDIRYRADRRYLQLRLHGDWDHAIFDRFTADYLAAVERLAGHGSITHQLVDASGFGLQAPDLAERFAPLIARTHQAPDLRTACVVPSLVNRIQARPGGDLINARYFRTVEDAGDWLFSNEA